MKVVISGRHQQHPHGEAAPGTWPPPAAAADLIAWTGDTNCNTGAIFTASSGVLFDKSHYGGSLSAAAAAAVIRADLVFIWAAICGSE